MDINKHLKELNLTSIKRNRKKSVPVPTSVIIAKHEHTVDLIRFNKDGQMYCKVCKEIMTDSNKIMNIKPTNKKKVKNKEVKNKQPKVEKTPPKKGFWSKLLGALKSIIFRM